MTHVRIKPSYTELLIISILLIGGLAFIGYMYTTIQEQNHRDVLRIGQSVVAALPADKIAQLSALPGDTAKPAYQQLKAALREILNQNKQARFAYLYTQSHGKYYFLLDSELPGSPDYSPPGQEYAEAAAAYKKPFTDQKSLITPPSTDRWGTWVSVLVPVKESAGGKTLAVFAMDIAAKTWNRSILVEVAESSSLVLALFLLILVVMRYMAKNRFLQNEISERSKAEKALTESEERFRMLYEESSIGIYQTTPEGNVLLSNKALLNILGYDSFDGLKDRNIEEGEFDPSYSRSEFKEAMEKEGKIQGLENAWKRQDGKMVYIRENAKAIRDSEGKILYYDGTIEDITERKLAEKALQYSEERFRQIAEQSREMVWEVDPQGLYTYTSPLSLSVLGYSSDELVGKLHFYDLHPPDDREYFRKSCMEVFQRKESFHDFINQVIKGTGESIWVITNGVPILDENGNLTGYRGADSDISDRIQQESLLKKLTLAVEQSPVSIIITNIDGAIEYGNPKACETTGYSPEELKGQNPRILKSGLESITDYKVLWETILSGKVWQGELLNQRKNGETYWEAATISPILNDEGQIINFLAVKEDITHMKKLISELQEAKDRAESSDLLKSAFIKNISHEIRTPLNGIVGMSEQLLKSSLSQHVKEQLLELIKESSDRLINTVNSYLDISMIVSGNVAVDAKPFDLNQLLNGIKDEILLSCLSKNLELQLLLPAEHSVRMVNSDADMLIKILMQLLNNAVKFTESGGISFGYESAEGSIEFFVKDTGIGIDKDFLPDIFETFTQADVSDTRAYEGSGLGLAIAFRLAHLLSGDIRVESEKAQGTAFFLTIPIHDLIENPGLKV